MTATITADAITLAGAGGQPLVTVESNGDDTFTVVLHTVTTAGPWPALPGNIATEDLVALSQFIRSQVTPRQVARAVKGSGL